MTDAEFRGDFLHDITCLQYVLHGARYLTFVIVADTSMLKVIVSAAIYHHRRHVYSGYRQQVVCPSFCTGDVEPWQFFVRDGELWEIIAPQEHRSRREASLLSMLYCSG